MFWSYFTADGTGPLVKCTNHMTSAEYLTILENELVPFLPEIATITFQQDNAPIHTSNLMKNFFQDHGINVLDWVPQSPDLNPIEFLWDVLGRRIRKRPVAARNLVELESHLKEEWSHIHHNFLGRVIDSMPKRIRLVIKANGNVTQY
jgi:transposase